LLPGQPPLYAGSRRADMALAGLACCELIILDQLAFQTPKVSKLLPRGVHMPGLPGSVYGEALSRVLWKPTERIALGVGEHEATSDRRVDSAGSGAGPALQVRSLTKAFGERVAYEKVSFEVERGEVFGFLGPNGAGKTTMVRTLATLISPTSGTATVAGFELTPANSLAIRQRIALAPETPGLYERLSVRDNLACFAELYEVADPAQRISQVLEAVGLSDRAREVCGALSKGLRQRVSLARALLGSPEIVFLDEPTSGLDPSATREVHSLIVGLRQQGVTVFLTTHRLEEAERLCDRVGILRTRLLGVGRPEELRRRLFSQRLRLRILRPLDDPGGLFGSLGGIKAWVALDGSTYELEVTDTKAVAPELVRALVAEGADVVSVEELRRSLEDVYMQLMQEESGR